MICPFCKGKGFFERVKWASPLGLFVETVKEKCLDCNGTGRIGEKEKPA